MKRYTYLSGKNEGLRCNSIDEDIEKFPSIISTKNGEVFLENIEEPHHIYIFGAGHVSKALADQANLLNIQTTIIDDRDEFVSSSRFPLSFRICTSDYEGCIESIDFKTSDSVVIMTRGHKDDYLVLRCLLFKENLPSYIGMIGSNAKVKYVFDKLKNEDGISASLLKKVHSPIGLPFDTETPAEIALSIMAEIYTTRHTKGVSIVEKDTLEAINTLKDAIEVIIIEKHGSAPRNVGSRMVVNKNSVIGTIGGGAIEAECIKDAREMLKTNEKVIKKHYSLENKTAINLGMVCGGNITTAMVRL